MAVKQRSDEEVLALLRKHDVPDDLTQRGFYQLVEQQAGRHRAGSGTKPMTAGQLAESFARAFGFTHWTTLRYLLKRRDRIRKKGKTEGRPVEVPPGLSAGQLGYLKKLGYRKAEVVNIHFDGRQATITHRTTSDHLITYQVDPKGNARYLSPAAI